jgi:TonB family protein
VSSAFVLLALAFACERDDQTVYTEVDEMAEFPGGIQAIQQFISDNLSYPDNAEKNGIEGKVFAQFVVSKEGKVIQAEIVRSVSPELDEEALRVVNLLPEWTPAKLDGKPVNVQFTLPILFQLADEEYVAVEDMPLFKGGIDDVRTYIQKNISYPVEAYNKNITGKAYVQFDVSKSGEVNNVKLARSTGNEFLDKEALRVVESLPDWKPGMQSGEPVSVSFTIPIEFVLQPEGGVIVIQESKVKKDQMRLDIKVSDDNLTVSGKITDDMKNPINGVNIIIKGSNIGTITDNEGNFNIKLTDKNNMLVMSYIGKETIIWKHKDK